MLAIDYSKRLKETCVAVRVYVDRKLVMVASGFLAVIHDKWRWVSASHVFEEIDALIKGRDYALQWMTLDRPTDPAFFSYRPGMARRLDLMGAEILSLIPNMPTGSREAFTHLSKADIGLLMLSKLDRDLLTAMGARPFSQDEVMIVSNEDLVKALKQPPAFHVAGVPREGITIGDDGVPKEFTFLSLELAPMPGATPAERHLAMMKDYPPDLHLAPDWPRERFDRDVKGMSGGPVLAISEDYVRVAGILSGRNGWEQRRPRSLRIVAADIVFSFFDLLPIRDTDPED